MFAMDLLVEHRPWCSGEHSMGHSLAWEDDGVYVRFVGPVRADEIVAMYRRVSGDPRSDTIRYVISDYLGARRSPEMTRLDVQAFAALERGASYSNASVWRAAVARDPSIIEFLEYFASLRVSTAIADFLHAGGGQSMARSASVAPRGG